MGFSLNTGLTAAQTAQTIGTVGQGVAALAYGHAQNELARADAAGERDLAKAQAQRIMRATERRRGEARAATAASGAAIDQFSLANEQDILQAGETDAAMAILGGDRAARGIELGGSMARAAGINNLAASLYTGASNIKGWRGTKTQPFYDGTTGDFSRG